VTFIVVKAVGMLDLDQHSQKAYCKLFCHGNVELPEKSNCIKHYEMKRVTFYLQQTNRKKRNFACLSLGMQNIIIVCLI